MIAETRVDVPTVSDEDVQAFYAQNEQRMGGESPAAMQERIRDYLTAGHQRQVQRDYLAGLRQQAGVEILLEPPRALIQVAWRCLYYSGRSEPLMTTTLSRNFCW